MYDAVYDPYCYRGTTVLKNRFGHRSQIELDKAELFFTARRFDEPLPRGKLSYRLYLKIHRHLFQDVYSWAGRVRTVRMSKDGSAFCYPENIHREMRRIFSELTDENMFGDLLSQDFAAKAAHFMAELNAIHPYREGNGRTQNAFLTILADQAGHPLDLERLEPPRMMAAMIASFNGDEQLLVELILSLMRAR
jgi:cell filamentation protein